MRSAMSVIAATTAGSTSNPSCAANRAARIIRSGSSENDSCGVPGVRSTPAARSSRPPNGSSNRRSGSVTAIAFTVKSRRPRSPASESPYTTAGLRESAAYASDRYVVISTCHSPLRQPIVPKERPMSHTASAQPATSFSVVSGRAEVVKSRSLCSRPSSASRTGPPTSAICSPAAVKRRPSSSTTGESRSSSWTARACAARIDRSSGGPAAGAGGSSDTGRHSMPGRCPLRPGGLPGR